ncbi:MAG: DUF2169 domain-containing protein, partial [Deltaproteobacteria bacterium]|nr:DUF2169 domain-containing protein [Deltaproteobacteria bacterium]
MEIRRETRIEVAFVPWQARPPRASLTVIAKATFAIDPDARTCKLADEQAPLTGDVHQSDDPDRSLRFESDLAVLKPRAEWVLAGTCHPPGGPRSVSAVAASVGGVRKELAVFGDRELSMIGSVRDAKPFASMALTWERAYGGPGFADNPFGRGIAPTETPEGPKTLWPNVQSAAGSLSGGAPRKEAVGFGPLPRSSSVRRRRLGTYDAAWRKNRWPYFPEDFDFEHFLAAPEDQRVDAPFRGDEVIELVNLHPKHAVVSVSLPGVRPRAFVKRVVVGPDGKPTGLAMEEVGLRLDTLAIDADAMRVYATWRGLVEVADEQATDIASLHVLEEPIGSTTSSDEHARGIVARESAALEARQRELRGEEPPARSKTAEAASGLRRESLAPGQASGTAEGHATRDALLATLAPALARPSRPLGAPLDVPPPLRGRDLTGADLSGMDLRNADLRGAILRDARMTDAMLDGARLDDAVLAGAYLSRSSLRGASLVGVDLTGARARKTSFQNASLSRATMHDADLASSSFDGAHLDGAELVGARAADATFLDANLDRADLRRAFLGRAKLDGASLVRANLEGAGAPESSFVGANLQRLKAARAVFVGASFVRAQAPHAVLLGADLERADLSYASLERANLTGASLARAVLHGTKLQNATLSHAKLAAAAILKSNLM